MKNFFLRLFRNLKNIYAWPNAIWHIILVALTFTVVHFGLDWRYFVATRDISAGIWIAAGAVGAVIPLFLPILAYLHGFLKKDARIKLTALALGQAAILGSFTSSLYKAFTGRIPPDLSNVTLDISNGFRLGFWEGGIFWGWPSSHTTIAFAMAVTLITMYPKSYAFRYIGILYALFIGFGASIGFHWLSEVLAGIILGSVVGFVVGKIFRS